MNTELLLPDDPERDFSHIPKLLINSYLWYVKEEEPEIFETFKNAIILINEWTANLDGSRFIVNILNWNMHAWLSYPADTIKRLESIVNDDSTQLPAIKRDNAQLYREKIEQQVMQNPKFFNTCAQIGILITVLRTGICRAIQDGFCTFDLPIQYAGYTSLVLNNKYIFSQMDTDLIQRWWEYTNEQYDSTIDGNGSLPQPPLLYRILGQRDKFLTLIVEKTNQSFTWHFYFKYLSP